MACEPRQTRCKVATGWAGRSALPRALRKLRPLPRMPRPPAAALPTAAARRSAVLNRHAESSHRPRCGGEGGAGRGEGPAGGPPTPRPLPFVLCAVLLLEAVLEDAGPSRPSVMRACGTRARPAARLQGNCREMGLPPQGCCALLHSAGQS